MANSFVMRSVKVSTRCVEGQHDEVDHCAEGTGGSDPGLVGGHKLDLEMSKTGLFAMRSADRSSTKQNWAGSSGGLISQVRGHGPFAES